MNGIDRRKFLGSAAAFAAGAGMPSSTHGNLTAGKTKFAVNVEMWMGRMPFIDRVKRSAALGFPAVEFWPWRNKNLDALLPILETTGIKVAQFTAWGFRPGLNEKQNHERFEKAIIDGCKAAKKIGCQKMTVVAGNDVTGMTQEQMHDNVILGLKRVKKIVEDQGVMLILEPMNIRVDHKGHCLYGSPAAIRICREVDSPMVKINWDLYHMQISEGDLCGRMREGWDQIGYLQLADHPGRCEPGTGEIHYNRVLKEAWDLGYRDFVGLECRTRDGVEKAVERVRAADVW